MTPATPTAAMLAAAISAAEAAGSVTITDDASAEQAQKRLDELQRHRAAAERARKDGKSPWLAGGREVDANFKPVTDALDRAKAQLKGKMSAYLTKVRTAQREAALAAERHAAEEVRLKKAAGAESMSEEGHMTPRLRPQDQAPETPQFSTTRIPTLVIYDESAVPDRFKTIDRAKVMAAINAGEHVPGVRKEMREQIRAGRGGRRES